ncbi:MAG: N-acetylglucosamine-6-phosphate deacetylase [Clostridia bacterium]|nr:N-acetylglucosamine-6-phosphate deacetylase [Clostridia bacterium]
MQAIVNGRILLPTGEITGQALLFDNVILGLCEQPPENAQIIDAQGRYVAPGLIDTHIHGYLGADASDGDADGLRCMAEGLLRNGVTSFLPTTMTIPLPQLRSAFAVIRSIMTESARPDFRGAQIRGCHAEGPCIAPARKGAQREDACLLPDAGLLLQDADVIRLVTLAPELPGAAECIRTLTAAGIHVSLGHTDCDLSTALDALAAGADRFTHTFNAMSPLHHRQPGAVGAALISEAYCELIADCFHVHPGLFALLDKLKDEKLLLVSDCTRAGGMPDGQYDLGGQTITVRGAECRLADGTIAGSVLRLNEAVRNLRDRTPMPLYRAVRCASEAPARSLGLDAHKGSLRTSRDADILLMNEDCSVEAAWIKGVRKL